MPMTRRTALLRALLAALPGAPAAQPAPVPLLRLNHIPLAVRDLEQAAESYRRLGFALKAGRPHGNGIRNQHIKFPADGGGIELITAGPTQDGAADAEYARLLAQGEGPAYVCFTTPDLTVLQARLLRHGVSTAIDGDGLLVPQDARLRWMFFAQGDNRSPTDRPEHFAHANTADTLLAVWIAGGERARLRAFFAAIGARIVRQRVQVPDPVIAEVAQLAGGEVILLPGSRQLLSGRCIIGATMGVRDLAAARRVLAAGGVQGVERRDLGEGGIPSLFIGPQDTHNLWLKLRERPAGH